MKTKRILMAAIAAVFIVQDGHFTNHPEYSVGETVACLVGNPQWSSLKGE